MARYTGKKCQNGKNFSPPRTVISVAWWWAKKKWHFVHSSQSYGGSKFNVPKNDEKSTHFEADLELGSRFGPERGQKIIFLNMWGKWNHSRQSLEAYVSLVSIKSNLILYHLGSPHTCFCLYSWESLKSDICRRDTTGNIWIIEI